MNFFIGKIAKSIDSYSDSLDFARIMSIFYFKIEILKKLIGKLKIIEKKLNKVLKCSLKGKLFDFIGIGENKDEMEKRIQKKKVLSSVIIKYLKGIDIIDKEEENLMNESILLKSEIDQKIKNQEKIDEDWVLVCIKNKHFNEEPFKK